ncbi:tRNA pseudouridine(55) synthase TruB, partial [Candidatus Uhrbacteria bacterium]|nr:tRNA pseudouridine(55) synthase TruB [Candidatus Uhrbacteria bacterium]
MNPPEGFLLVDKPPGPTSHDIVDRVRRVVRLRQVGHAGTLDPFASGLLILGIGKATKQLSHLVGLGKTYEAMFVLGGRSTTDDRMGAITFSDAPLPSPAQIEEAMEVFRGDILQIPPTYSAIKIGGKKMYKAARAGKPLEAPPRPATVYAFDLAGELEQM